MFAMTFVADYKVNGKQSIKAKEMLAAWLSGAEWEVWSEKCGNYRYCEERSNLKL
jgi:hypothetical protein